MIGVSVFFCLFVCLSVCLSACLSYEPDITVRSVYVTYGHGSVHSAIYYVLPVLWMTSYSHTVLRIGWGEGGVLNVRVNQGTVIKMCAVNAVDY